MKTLIDLSEKIFEIGDLLHTSEKYGNKQEILKRNKKDANGKIICDQSGLPIKEKYTNGRTYNENRDIDQLCFKNALARFIRTGTREDAFDVFFCYAEIFKTFGGYKNGIDSLLQLLYHHESTSASLLKKHRDHYSHSVYVFALGLSIFMNNKNMREAFVAHFGKKKLYYNFLKYWGMAALFHDIGYPYEIAFLQVKQYGEKIDNKDLAYRLRMRYDNLDGFVALSDEEVERCGEFMPRGKSDVNSLFTDQILKTFGAISGFENLDRKIVQECLERRITNADENMDHGYFSAVLFLKKLLKYKEFKLDQPTLDTVMAMFLHNSFYKYTYKDEIKGKELYQLLHLKDQPLAYLLMLCDELQCWDRVPYGEVSRKQEIPWDMDLTVNDDAISVVYYFENGTEQESVDKIDGLVKFINSKVINTDELATLRVSHSKKFRDKKVYDYFSECKFIDLCKIAETICINYNKDCSDAGHQDVLREDFDDLLLEYKLSNIGQAKQYSRHLEDINCFFSDRQLDYPVVEKFTDEEITYLAIKEHIRWVSEKVTMGWRYGRQVETAKLDDDTCYAKSQREKKRLHKDIVPFEALEGSHAERDVKPIERMIENLSAYGIKIYRINSNKPTRAIGCTGHIDLSRIENFNEEDVRAAIRLYMNSLQEKYKCKLYSGLGWGADLLFAEEALKCNIELVAVLPCEWSEFAKEHPDGGKKFMQILGQSVEVKTYTKGKSYEFVRDTLLENCDELIALWDGVELPLKDENENDINLGGTYDTIRRAYKKNMPVIRF